MHKDELTPAHVEPVVDSEVTALALRLLGGRNSPTSTAFIGAKDAARAAELLCEYVNLLAKLDRKGEGA